jgi:hypothetical protein
MKYFRFFLAVILLPVAAAVAWSFFYLLVYLGRSVSTVVLPFWLGLASYFIFQVIFFRPLRTYVFGHELTHALVGLLSGARLKSFKVSSSGGSVVLTKTNVWIALAPYFIPIYTIVLIVLYSAGSRFWPFEPYRPYYLFAVGFTLSFHFGLTYFALAQGQSDLKQFGVFFSSILILIINCLLLTGVLKLLFPEHVSVSGFTRDSMQKALEIVGFVYQEGVALWGSFRTMK